MVSAFHFRQPSLCGFQECRQVKLAEFSCFSRRTHTLTQLRQINNTRPFFLWRCSQTSLHGPARIVCKYRKYIPHTLFLQLQIFSLILLLRFYLQLEIL